MAGQRNGRKSPENRTWRLKQNLHQTVVLCGCPVRPPAVTVGPAWLRPTPPRSRYPARCCAAAHRGGVPCRLAEIPRHRAGEPPADRHPPDAGGAAPAARGLRPVPRAPSTGRLVRALSAEAKWLAGECAPARDLHVFLTETVDEVPPIVRRIGSRLAKTHLERARTALSGARFDGFRPPARRLRRAVAGRHRTAARRIRQRPCSSGATTRSCGAAASSARSTTRRLHRLRIAIKKLRYAATFLRPAFASPDRAQAYIEATVRLQGALGALNDRAVAAQMLADIATAARPTEDVAQPLRALAKQAASGSKRRRRQARAGVEGRSGRPSASGGTLTAVTTART